MAQVLKDHNGGVTASLVANYVRDLAKIEKDKADLKDREKTLKNRAGDDGIDIDILKESIKMAKQDPQTVIDRENKRVSYLKLQQSPLGERMSFIEDDVAFEDLTEEQRNGRWRAEGYRAGLDGKNKDTCPHDPNSEAGRAWAAGWESGQGENFKGIKEGPKPRSPRGGRKKKDEAPANDPTPAAGEESPEPEGDASEEAEQTDDDEAPPAPPTGRMSDEDFEANG